MKAIIKFNNGLGALLCSSCDIIIRTGFEHDLTKAHYCDKCEENTMHKDIKQWQESDMNLQRMDSKKIIEELEENNQSLTWSIERLTTMDMVNKADIEALKADIRSLHDTIQSLGG
jgi:late competence protein required for DNA uptake (superfamily II DNA/RNA helicase)